MRRSMITLFASLMLAGCSLADSLENAPCNGDVDCVGDQTCVPTLHQQRTGAPGWCRSNGRCAAGEQEGCRAPDAVGSCDAEFTKVCKNDGTACFCCEPELSDANATPVLAEIAPGDASAWCVWCSDDACGSDEESCIEGEPRCKVGADGCGCRLRESALLDRPCDDDDDVCTDDYHCVRTLEQVEEPQEPEPFDQPSEPGWCRPEGESCVEDEQPGCLATDSWACESSLQHACAGNRCFCCPKPSNTDAFNAHVYAIADDGRSAACTACKKSECGTGTQTCTAVEGSQCDVVSGLCGCAPTG